jgi:hypothetical protein
MDERRIKPRVDTCLEARLEGAMNKNSVRIVDISEGGCYVDTMGESLVGELITVTIHTPNDEWISFKGEVAHCSPRLGFGVRFVELTDAQIEKLRVMMGLPSNDHNESLMRAVVHMDLTNSHAM